MARSATSRAVPVAYAEPGADDVDELVVAGQTDGVRHGAVTQGGIGIHDGARDRLSATAVRATRGAQMTVGLAQVAAEPDQPAAVAAGDIARVVEQAQFAPQVDEVVQGSGAETQPALLQCEIGERGVDGRPELGGSDFAPVSRGFGEAALQGGA